MAGSCPASPNAVRSASGRAVRTAFMPSISLGQSAAGVGGAGGVVGSSGGGGGVGSVDWPLVTPLWVDTPSVLPSPVIWANAPAATVRVRATTRHIAPASTFIALSPFGLTLWRKTLAKIYYFCYLCI